jgi:CspA family cold shock protein
MTTGTVKYFNAPQGYGFIQIDDGTADVFVHVSAVQRSDIGALCEGQAVSFDVEESTPGAPVATNLQIA